MHACCQCGTLTADLAADAEPATVVCHCRACRRRSGSAFGALAYFPNEKVRLHGLANEFTRTTDVGNSFTNAFCPTCGSTVYVRLSKYPGMIGIALGAIEGTVSPPLRSVYERSKEDWLMLSDAMDHHAVGKDS